MSLLEGYIFHCFSVTTVINYKTIDAYNMQTIPFKSLDLKINFQHFWGLFLKFQNFLNFFLVCLIMLSKFFVRIKLPPPFFNRNIVLSIPCLVQCIDMRVHLKIYMTKCFNYFVDLRKQTMNNSYAIFIRKYATINPRNTLETFDNIY